MNRQFPILAVMFFILMMVACSEVREETDVQIPKRPLVFVSNYPLQYFVERIASSLVEIQFPATVSSDPAYWKPTAEDIAAIQEADLIVLNGASYEKWLANVTLPQSKLIETSEGFGEKLIPLEETVTHSHGPAGEHAHEGNAFTTWLDLELAAAMARAVFNALGALLPTHEATFADRFAQLESDLVELDADIEKIILSAPETHVVFSHPVYQYFEKRYGVKGVSVHWEPDAIPDEGMWKEFRHMLDDHPAKWMIWEGEPLNEVVDKLERLGVKSIVFDPCGNVPDAGDFLSVMRDNTDSLKQVFGNEKQ
jgi:zinc transport system substrate-binding protein